MEPFVPPRPHSPPATLRSRTRAHSGPNVPTHEMPSLALGAHKVVTGLSRSVSSSSSSSSAFAPSSNDSSSSLSSTTSSLDDSASSLAQDLFGSPASSFGSPPPAYHSAGPTAPVYGLELKSSANLFLQAPLPLDEFPADASEFTNVLPLLLDPTSPLLDLAAVSLKEGTIVSHPTQGTRVLYTNPDAAPFERDAICDLLELAEEQGCTGLVLPVKVGDGLGERLHELMYLGGVVCSGEAKGQDGWVLVGLEV